MTEEDRGLGIRWFEEVWNKGRRDVIAEMLAPDAVLHEGGVDSVGPEGFYPLFDRMRAAFSEVCVTVHDTNTEFRLLCEFMGVPATQRTVHMAGISIIRVAGGRLVEAWQNWDMLGLLEQIQGMQRSATYVSAH